MNGTMKHKEHPPTLTLWYAKSSAYVWHFIINKCRTGTLL